MESIQTYRTLIHRLKEFDFEECENVRKAYVQKFSELYKKELRDYFHALKKTILREKSSKRKIHFGCIVELIQGNFSLVQIYQC